MTKFKSRNFADTEDLDIWLSKFPNPEIVGYSAYGVRENRYHNEFTAGVFVTIKYDDYVSTAPF
jgi:hypothetical protein